ncbi:HET-domain-containing protein [Curvularia clavata]|uniref:HET-domain-containing protein n=1 Tax=Curvularia clavata TaxID=95742 RepID=A0A9Q8Z2S0_CURCL|nr:HET-domain-containing protein [Curvularia clavata]
MEKYGLPKGLVWQAGPRMGGRDMDEEEVLEMLKSWEQVEEVLVRTDPAARADRYGPSGPPRNSNRTPKKPAIDVEFHEVEETGPGVSPLENHVDSSGQRSKPPNNSRQLFVFGSSKTPPTSAFTFGQSQPSNSGPSSEFSFGCENAIAQAVQPYRYCGFCKVILKKARAIRMRPPGCTSTGFGIHIEDGACDCCQDDSFSGQEVRDLFSRHLYTLESVRKSAQDGCHLCSMLIGRETVLDEPESDPESDFYGVAVSGKQSYDGPGNILLQKMISKEGGPITLRTIELSYGHKPKDLSASLQHTRTDSQPLYAMAKEWLRKCRENHDSCNKVTTRSGFLPTRLIKITAVGGDVISLKLCATSDLPNRNISYFALSHRWGGHSFSLVSKNYNSLLNDIPIDSLPQNFLDATQITSKMGFYYLWIDSLCIIQDSPVDKAREIPAMGEVYGNATLTIAALAAENSNGGCFKSRYPLSLVPALLRDGIPESRDRIWAVPEKSRGPSSNGDKRPPLHTRGWVVQERALAPRTLNFGADMVHWECIEGTADELSPLLHRDIHRLSSGAHIDMGLKSSLEMIRREAKAGLQYEDWSPFWWRIVREYTASNLTFNSDKWNAIAALAKQAEKVINKSSTPNRLFFGLWGRNLTEELMWKIRKPGKRIDPAEFKAPTWSWLSVDAAVVGQRFDFEKIDVRMAMAEADNKARLSFDGLGATNKAIIHGCIFDLELKFKRDREGNRIYEFQSVRGQGKAFSKDDYAFQWWPDTHLENSVGLAILPLVGGKRDGDGCSGLVVQPGDPAKLSWERVGCFKLIPVGRKCEGSTKHFDGKRETIILV